jgi:multiple sugar transport system ATP-binding protein
MARVVLEHVCKTFDHSVVAVDDLNLVIEHGEFVILLGPSGCGKSTTLFMIAGLVEETGGNIYFDDQRVTNLPPHLRDIAMVFQSYALYPHMSVRDNMGFGLKMRGVPKTEINRRVDEASGMLGITPLLDRRPRQLSGGQRQRVALGRAIVREPKVFLLDEPLSNLDAKLRAQTRIEVKALHRRLGATFVYVTHDQVEAMSMGDRIAVMNAGRLQQYGTRDEIYYRPANMFVAGFIGSPAMNFFEGSLQQQDGGWAFASPSVRQALSPERAASVKGGVGKAVMGVRPEDILVSHTPQSPADLQAVVEFEEPLGADLLLVMRLGDRQIIARTDPDFRSKAEDVVWIRFKPDKLHLFDGDSSVRL